MRLLFALLAVAPLGVCVTACGDASSKGARSAPNVSSNAVAAAIATAEVSVASASDTASTRHYLNDGDKEPIGDNDGDNSGDFDNDAFLDYKADENGKYHDSDDAGVLTYGHVASPAEDQQVTAAVRRYYALLAAHDGKRACSMIVPGLVNAMPLDYGRLGPLYLRGGKTCAAVVVLLVRHYHRQLIDPVHVTSVRVQGDGALVLLGSRTMPSSQINLVRQGGAWKLSMLIGSPLV